MQSFLWKTILRSDGQRPILFDCIPRRRNTKNARLSTRGDLGDLPPRGSEPVLPPARPALRTSQRGLLSHEHFTVDGTLIDAWASLKSFQRKDAAPPPPDDLGNLTLAP
jgi:hypothetical protein